MHPEHDAIRRNRLIVESCSRYNTLERVPKTGSHFSERALGIAPRGNTLWPWLDAGLHAIQAEKLGVTNKQIGDLAAPEQFDRSSCAASSKSSLLGPRAFALAKPEDDFNFA
jgi:hypothetical protein